MENTNLHNKLLRLIPRKSCGIYRIKNTLDGKIYIGSANDIKRRLRIHLLMLRKEVHSNRHLQRAFNRDGEAAFVFDVICLCEKSELLIKEQEYLDQYKSYDDSIGYNISKRADAGPVLVYDDAMRQVISQRFKGVKKSDEHKKRISDAHKQKQYSDETRKKISEGMRRFFSDADNLEAHRQRFIGKAHKGTPHTEESKKKLSESRKGIVPWNKGIPQTEETKRKLALAHIGKKASDETRLKMSRARKGKPKKKTGPISEDHRRNLSKALRGKPNYGNRKYTDDQIKKWIDMRSMGMSFLSIEREINISGGIIFKAIKRYLKEHPDESDNTCKREVVVASDHKYE